MSKQLRTVSGGKWTIDGRWVVVGLWAPEGAQARESILYDPDTEDPFSDILACHEWVKQAQKLLDSPPV